jgi:hypothetical protein
MAAEMAAAEQPDQESEMMATMGFSDFSGREPDTEGVEGGGTTTTPTDPAPAGKLIASAVVEDFHDGAGSKLAAFAAEAFPQFGWSRNKARGEVKAGLIRVNGLHAGANQVLRASDTVTVHKVAKVQWRNGMWCSTVVAPTSGDENMNSKKREKLAAAAAAAAAGGGGEFGVHLDVEGKCTKRKRGINCGCPDCCSLSEADKKKIRNRKKREAKARKLAAVAAATARGGVGGTGAAGAGAAADHDPVAAAKAAAAEAKAAIAAAAAASVAAPGAKPAVCSATAASTSGGGGGGAVAAAGREGAVPATTAVAGVVGGGGGGGGGDPEQLAATQEPLCWRYLDAEGAAQGPFTASAMRAWYAAGYLPATLEVWRDGDDPTSSSSRQVLASVDELAGRPHGSSETETAAAAAAAAAAAGKPAAGAADAATTSDAQATTGGKQPSQPSSDESELESDEEEEQGDRLGVATTTARKLPGKPPKRRAGSGAGFLAFATVKKQRPTTCSAADRAAAMALDESDEEGAGGALRPAPFSS